MSRPLRVLHLENDHLDAELVQATLAESDLPCDIRRVETRVGFEEALKEGGFDVILSDFSLPSFDGRAAMALARTLQPGIPFILVSGTIGEDAAIESLVGGATDYVLKNRLARLVPAVRRALSEADDRRARQRAEAARRASEARYRRLFESSKDGLLVLDGASERVLDVNPALLDLLGWSRDAAVGQTVAALGLAGKDPECEAAFREILSRDATHHPDLRLWGDRGQAVDVDLVSTAYSVDGRREVQLSVRDLRERRRLERQLRTAQKLEAVGQLAGGIAHDFNNLLVVIGSYAEMAVETLRPEDPLRADLVQIQQAGARAADLTRQLLAFSRRQILQPVLVSLNVVVAGIEQMLRRLIGEDLELQIRLAPDLGNVRADPAQMEQVLMNLVLNARDAMPKGGSLVVETANAELDEAYVGSHPDAKPGRYVLLVVSDAGCGMDQETQGRIFEPFFTTKPAGRGTGLGLATVYGIVKQSGGHIGVYSEVGRGTTFRIYLPLDPAEAAAAEAEPRPKPAGGSEVILVVEDDESIRRLIPRILEPAGYTVLSAASGREALRLCEERHGPPHLLLADVVMPEMDGAAVAAKVQALCPAVRVLFMSGYLDEAIGRRGVPTASGAFVRKPFTAGELLRRLREALDA